MNYYEHHIGDFAEATMHLSFVEDAAYSRLIRKYYAQEKPLPADVKAVQRLVGARSKDEREAVESVLSEFFELQTDGWHQARCDAEIARYQDKQAKAKRSAQARWNAKPPHSEGNANASPNAMRTHSEGNAHQAPDTIHQTPITTGDAKSTSQGDGIPDGTFAPTIAGQVGMALKRAGLDPTTFNLSDPRLGELIRQGATVEEFEGLAKEAVSKSIRQPWPWILKVLPERRKDAQAISLPPTKPEEPWYETPKGVIAMGEKLGCGTWSEDVWSATGEQFGSYRLRVLKAAKDKGEDIGDRKAA